MKAPSWRHRRPGRYWMLIVLALAFAMAGCPSNGGDDGGDERVSFAPPGGQCYEQPGSSEYLEAMREKIESHWELPAGPLADDTYVTIRFTINMEGTLASLEVVGNGSDELNASAQRAARAAEPFGRIPEALRCMTYEREMGIIYDNLSKR